MAVRRLMTSVVGLAIGLAACSSDRTPDPTSTTVSIPASTSSTPPAAGATTTPATLGAINGPAQVDLTTIAP